MTSSLVGSEMCIRDRETQDVEPTGRATPEGGEARAGGPTSARAPRSPGHCLLYTSDAADDM
eukprot:9659719-Prorocentrum_lima.AAC.1